MVDIQEVKRYIRLHYQEIRSIDDVASFTKLSPETIRKDFIRNEHMRLSEYIARVRIEKAKRLLEQTKMTCRQICVTVGFSREEVGERVFHADIVNRNSQCFFLDIRRKLIHIRN